jgi:serine/threonine protein kinase/Tol biopolymer transport system component
MTPERWDRISALYAAAQSHAPHTRAAFLAAECGDDLALRQEVEALLRQNLDSIPAFVGVAPDSATNERGKASGARLGSYRLGPLIGAGGMGEVYRARDETLARDVAIKILPPAFAADTDRRARFEREARVLASLNHPHIAAIYGMAEGEGHRGIVLELVDGETLADRLRRVGRLPVAEVIAIARQLVDALDAAHERGIVHRDLKPANIKITADGVVKVLDFGLATAVAGDGSVADLTQSPTITVGGTGAGVLLGTAPYMSPEQARGQAVDKRTDIWAFGCVLYEMLTGRAAFAGATLADTLAAIVEREPDWAALPPTTPHRLARLLRRCLIKNVRERLRDIGDAIDALDDPAVTDARDEVVVPVIRRLFAPNAWTVAAVLMLASWLVYDRSAAPDPEIPGAVFTVRPPGGTSSGSVASAPLISPDGRTLAFIARTPAGQRRLWIRPMNSTVSQQLAGTDGAAAPFWAPDSRSIAFFANGRLSRVDVDTGAVRTLTEAPYEGGRSGTWGDGVILFYKTGGIFRVAPTGGPATAVLPNSPSGGYASRPSFLPDGRRFLYTWVEPRNSRVCLRSIDSSEPTCFLDAQISVRYAAPGYLLFVQNQSLKARSFDVDNLRLLGEPLTVTPDRIDGYNDFSVSDAGVLAYSVARQTPGRLMWLDRKGNPIGVPEVSGSRPALSPDQRWIAVERRDPQADRIGLWLIDRKRGTERPFTSPPSGQSWAHFSPGSDRIVYASRSNGTGSLRVKRTDGAGVEEVLPIEGNALDWSADGRFILFLAWKTQNGFDLWAFPMEGKREPLPVTQSAYDEREGRFSPDPKSKFVAYDSTENGAREVFVQSFPSAGTTRWQISTSGGVSPQWRQDGRELFYIAADGFLMAVPTRLEPTLEWDSPQRLFQTIFDGDGYASYAVSGDGQQFLVSVEPRPEDAVPITVLTNWRASLRK